MVTILGEADEKPGGQEGLRQRADHLLLGSISAREPVDVKRLRQLEPGKTTGRNAWWRIAKSRTLSPQGLSRKMVSARMRR